MSLERNFNDVTCWWHMYGKRTERGNDRDDDILNYEIEYDNGRRFDVLHQYLSC